MDADHETLQRLARQHCPGARLLRTWELQGGSSARLIAMEVEAEGRRQRWVLRRHGERDLARNPQAARDEFRLLQRLQPLGLGSPRPLHLDQRCAFFPSPSLLLECLPGEALRRPLSMDQCRQLARRLLRIHQVGLQGLDFLPSQAQRCEALIARSPELPDEELGEARLRQRLQGRWPFPHPNPPALLHGDFWPGNLLWEGEELGGVIDWEDAARGEPLADLANARLELFWACGEGAMRAFTEEYQALARLDFRDLPLWELWAALKPAGRLREWGLPEEELRRLHEGHGRFVEGALQRSGML